MRLLEDSRNSTAEGSEGTWVLEAGPAPGYVVLPPEDDYSLYGDYEAALALVQPDPYRCRSQY